MKLANVTGENQLIMDKLPRFILDLIKAGEKLNELSGFSWTDWRATSVRLP